MRNPKTTIAGILMILGAVSTLAGKALVSGFESITMTDLQVAGAAITAGSGLIAARDAIK
jgi:hypothetical protein